MELKSLVADQLQQQGVPVQADSITDEMLLNQISTNATLRANITVWLRARGYVSEADMDRLLSSAAAEDENDSALSPSQLLTAPVDGLSFSGRDRAQSGSVSGIGQPSTDRRRRLTLAQQRFSSSNRALSR